MAHGPTVTNGGVSCTIGPWWVRSAAMTAQEWLAEFAARLGVDPPDPDTVEELLALAGTAAHASERIAAPLACWMVGRAGVAPAEAGRLAAQVEAGDG
jgi:hypothetical protein